MFNTMRHRDLLCGLMFAFSGAAILVYSLVRLPLGSFDDMGPGMYPSIIGTILCGLGIAISCSGLLRNDQAQEFDVRSLLAVASAIAFFAWMLPNFGLVPTVIISVMIASLASKQFMFIRALSLGVILSLAATVIFIFGLGMMLPTFSWPW